MESCGGRCFFGFAAALRSKHTPKLLAGLRADELLAESDARDAFAARVAASRDAIAAARGWSDAEARARLDANAEAFLGAR